MRQKASDPSSAQPLLQFDPETALALARSVKRRTAQDRPRARKREGERRRIVAALESLEEVKYSDTYSAFGQVDRGGNVDINSCSIAQGTQQGQRVGDRVVVKRFSLRYSAYLNITAALTALNTHTFRVLVLRWNLSSSVITPTVSNILQSGAAVNATISPVNWQGLKQGDFQVLYDQVHSVGAYDDAQNHRVVLDGHWPVQYDPGAVSGEGKFVVLTIGDDVTGAHAPDVQLQYYARVEYIDA